MNKSAVFCFEFFSKHFGLGFGPDKGPGPKHLETNLNQNTALFFIIFSFFVEHSPTYFLQRRAVYRNFFSLFLWSTCKGTDCSKLYDKGATPSSTCDWSLWWWDSITQVHSAIRHASWSVKCYRQYNSNNVSIHTQNGVRLESLLILALRAKFLERWLSLTQD